jgi:hypothetical protein
MEGEMTEKGNQSEKPRPPFAIRGLLYDYFSLACVGFVSFSLFIINSYLYPPWNFILAWSLPVIVLIGIILAIRGILFGVQAVRKQEAYGLAIILFGAVQILLLIGFMNFIPWIYITG